MKKPIRTPLTQDQLADAKRLSDIYKARAKASRQRGDAAPLTQTDVGEECGWSSPQSTVSQYMNGKVALNLDALIKLSKALDFNPADVSPTLAGGLLVKRGDYANQEAGGNGSVSETGAQYSHAGPGSTPLPARGEVDEDRYEHIPQYTAKAAAGLGYENLHVESFATLAFKRDWLKAKGAKPESLMIIYADGESMWPTIDDHDVLLVDTSKTEPVDGQVFVLASNDKGAIVKRLVQSPLGSWIIRSDNEDKAEYGDLVLTRSDVNEHRIIGRVIWRGGDL